MLQTGPAKKVTIFVNEDTRHHLGPLSDAILTFLLHKGVSGATATRAVSGFGAHQVMHTSKIEALAEHLPIRIEFIDSAAKVDELMPKLSEMVTDGVIEVQDTEVVTVANKDHPEPKRPHHEVRGPARLMRIYMAESDPWKPIVDRLRGMDIGGATVYRGILGYGTKRHTHVPVVISVVDTEEKLRAALEAIEPIIEEALIVFSEVEMIRMESGDANQ
jgi:PII-like signaling protein